MTTQQRKLIAAITLCVVTGFRACPVVVFALAMNLAFAGVARSEDSTENSEREFVESIVPGLKALREFPDKLDEKLAQIKRLGGGTSIQLESVDQGGSAAESIDQLPDVQVEKSREQIQKDLLNALTLARREQFQLVENMRKQLRLYVSVSVDRCKQSIAAGDEVGARASCGIAENKMKQCEQQVAPEINRRADRLTAQYKPIYGDMGDFSNDTIFCPSVFAGLDDPGKLLSRAEIRLPDESCYKHAARVEQFAKAGVVQNWMGKDDASVPAYLLYIRRKCPERIANQAQLGVDEALRSKEAAERQQKATEKPDAPEPNAETEVLTRPGGNSGSKMIEQAIDQAEQEEKDRPAREAREREEKARAAEQERLASEQAAANARAAARAAEIEQARRSEEDARDTHEALALLVGVVGQISQNKLDQQLAQEQEQQRLLKAQQEQQMPAQQGSSSDGSGASGCVPGTQSVMPCNGACGPGLALHRYYVYKDRTKYDLRCIRE